MHQIVYDIDFSHWFAFVSMCSNTCIISEGGKATIGNFLKPCTQIFRFYDISIIGPYPISSN